MKIITGSIFKLSIKYVYSRNDTFYYQRKIPIELQSRYEAKHVKVNLKTTDIREVSHKVIALNKQYDSAWEAMRTNDSITPQSVRQSAITLLKQYGLNPLPSQNPELNLDHFIDVVIEPKREAYAEGDEETYRTSSPENYLTPVATEAFKLLRTAPKLILSEGLDVYLNGHKKKNDQSFRTYTKRSWNKLIDILGDIPFEQINRANANQFVEKFLESGVKTTTVRRTLNVIKAIFNVVIIERELVKSNPFNKLRIAGLGEDTIKREQFNTSELVKLSKACIEKNDDMRWLLALQLDLGSRVGEIAGLALSDIKIDAEIPYVIIQAHPWRSLKTTNSKREVPLVGLALWGASQVIANATKEQIFAFPRYTNAKTCNATAASGALNGWIKSKDIQATTHGFRHSMKDRLREVDAPEAIQLAVGGWSRKDMASGYGKGHSLRVLKG
ncbi:MAG: tyrosine-type recombinase/integrase [Methylotenera sp.]|uniref:phage integrase n=1 Tax=Methylotenera sp. TaxID=2051956 RepID=UPI00248A868E|nr:DUF6538 domain-containing protein [Methylotenera sp.]MDI1309853.1 tyrosine-type recombinase/integrase [Methylotenera sp.]